MTMNPNIIQGYNVYINNTIKTGTIAFYFSHLSRKSDPKLQLLHGK